MTLFTGIETDLASYPGNGTSEMVLKNDLTERRGLHTRGLPGNAAGSKGDAITLVRPVGLSSTLQLSLRLTEGPREGLMCFRVRVSPLLKVGEYKGWVEPLTCGPFGPLCPWALLGPCGPLAPLVLFFLTCGPWAPSAPRPLRPRGLFGPLGPWALVGPSAPWAPLDY